MSKSTRNIAVEGCRNLFMILSPRSLPYAAKCVSSLFANSVERLNIRFLTDSARDKDTLEDTIGQISNPHKQLWSVFSDEAVEQLSLAQWENFPNLQSFRRGHPCWRKVTDPLLFTQGGTEAIILDPDLYFPNRFTFEPTPESGVLLMWQQPNCMLPPQTVRTAMHSAIRLARHVDIGVAQWRAGQDLGWFDWLIGRLGGRHIPPVMHVESIVWSALLMRLGGGHLDPGRWHCWHRSQLKRVSLKLGASGVAILRAEKFARMKCFHAGGEAKWWISDAQRGGFLDPSSDVLEPSPIRRPVELTRWRFETEQKAKDLLRRMGYYNLFGQFA
jgi:hypothetical protein